MDEMVNRVLSLCPECDLQAVKDDLNVTGDVEWTLNRALDGLLSPKSKALQDTSPMIVMDNDDDDIIVLSSTSKFTCIRERNKRGVLPEQSDQTAGETISPVNANFSSKLTKDIPKKSSDLELKTSKKSTFLEILDSDSDCEQDTQPLSRKQHKNTLSSKVSNVVVSRNFTSSNEQSSSRDSSSESDTEFRIAAFGKADCEHISKKATKDMNKNNLHVALSDVEKPTVSGNRCNKPNTAGQVTDINVLGGSSVTNEPILIEGPPKKKKRTKAEIEEQKRAALLRKEAKEKARQEKISEKTRQKEIRAAEMQQKKLRVEKEKLHKQAEKLTKSTTRLDGCIKLMTAFLDPSLLSDDSSGPAKSLIVQKLCSMEAKYEIKPQPIAGSVTWERTSVQHSVHQDEMKITSSNCQSEENEVLVVLAAEQFAEMVFAFKQGYQREPGSLNEGSRTLVDFTKDVQKCYGGKRVTFLLTGLERCIRNVKTNRQRAFRAAATGGMEETGGNPKRRRKKTTTTVDVTRTDIEEALVDLQFKTDVCVYPCETEEDVAMKIALFTKSVAERPYKKSLTDSLGFCLDKLDKTTLKVSKDGHGMINVWRQQIEQFRNVSRDMASAIVAEFPSPQLLLQAYQRCRSEKEATTLLEDILVRRGGGSLATCRRIGPELSKRFYVLFHSRDSAQLMKQK